MNTSMSYTKAYTSYNILRVNGQVYKGVDAIMGLVDDLMSTGEEQNIDIAQFFQSWFDEDDYIRLQSSGSTGTPKIIKVKKQAMVASSLRTIVFFELRAGDSALLCLSVKYIAGKMMLVRALVGQLNLLIGDVSSHALQKINRSVEFAAMVPMQLHTILSEDEHSLERVKKLIVGGGSVHPSLTAQLAGLNTEVWETYGMTETVSHIALRQLTVGNEPFTLLPGIHIDVDERGCLIILPSDITSEKLLTNDLVELVSDRQFRLLGRYDNIINTGAVKLVPEVIEAKLKPVISADFVISWKKDEVLGQKIVLVIEADAPICMDELDLSGLSKYELPKEVITLKDFPRTETGKVQRAKLQQQLQ